MDAARLLGISEENMIKALVEYLTLNKNAIDDGDIFRPYTLSAKVEEAFQECR